MELAVNTHVRHGTIFACELDAASRFVVGAEPRRYSRYGKLDVLLGEKRTPDLGALRLGYPDVIGIVADRLGHFFRLGKSAGESLSPVVGNERDRVFGDGIGIAIARAVSCKLVSPVGDFDFALYQRLVFPVYGRGNGI